jgi:hypothetical protein
MIKLILAYFSHCILWSSDVDLDAMKKEINESREDVNASITKKCPN